MRLCTWQNQPEELESVAISAVKVVMRLLFGVSLCLLCLVPVKTYALEEATWLYAVEQPVAAQTLDERQRAAAEGLLVVLSRLTGLASVPRSAAILAALERPEAYYNQFVFSTRDLPSGLEQRYLRITFQPAAIQNLIRSAQLPVWWSKRPKVLAWVVMDNAGERDILSSASEHPLLAELAERAASSGLPLTLPLMDLNDNLAITAADVWGKVGQSLDTASQRYAADLVLIGRLSLDRERLITGQPYRGDWEVWVDGKPLVDNFTGVSAQEAATRAIDLMANRLAEQYAVLPRSLKVQRLSVTGLDATADYAEFMTYLENLEFIDRVAITGLNPSAVQVALASRAEPEQLEMLLTAEGRLTRDRLYRGLDLQLIWRG